MRLNNLHSKCSLFLVVLGLLFCGPKSLIAADPHDYLYEDPFGDDPKFLSSNLRSEAEALVSLLKEKERLIRQGIESQQLEYSGNTLYTKPGASEEMVEGLSSLNSRIELLAQAKDIVSRLSKYRSTYPEDQVEVEQLKNTLEKAADEFQKIDDLKKQVGNLELKQLSSNITRTLLEIAEHPFEVNNAFQNDTQAIREFIEKLNHHLRELQKFTDLSSSDEKEKNQLAEEVKTQIKILESYQNIKDKNKTLKPEMQEANFENMKLGMKQFADRLANWTGNPSWKSQIDEGLKNLDQFIKKPDTSQKSQEEKSSAPNEVKKKKQALLPPIAKNEFADPEKNGFIEEMNLRSKYKESEKLKQEIESQLNSKKDIGINLELEYRKNLQNIESYQQSLNDQIKNAKFKSLENFFPDVFSPLNKLENPDAGNSMASENTKSIKNEVKPEPSASSTSPADSSEPPKKNDAIPPKQSNSVPTPPQSPRTTADNSGVGSAPDSRPIGTQSALGLDDNSTKTRISSFAEGETAEHRPQTTNINTGDVNSSLLNGRKADSKGSTATLDNEKTTKSTNKNPRKIASEDNAGFATNTNQGNPNNNSYPYISNAQIPNSLSYPAQSLGTKGSPFRAFSKSDTEDFTDSNNKFKSSAMSDPEGDSSTDLQRQKLSSDNSSETPEAGFSLIRNRPKRNSKTGNGQQKRRSNEDSTFSAFISPSATFPSNSNQYDGKSSTVKADSTYVQTPEKTLSQTPQKKGDIASNLTEKSEFENLSQISSDIKSGEMDTQLDPQPPQNSEKSIWEKIRLEPNLDLIGKIVSELYPPAAGLKPSDITELLSNKKLAREISSNMKSTQAQDKNNGVKLNIPTKSEKDTAKTSSLVSLILAWIGMN